MRQKYGQNFLVDNNIANNIVNALNLEINDEVLEIGPGKGILTKLLYPKVKFLTCIDIDSYLVDRLNCYFVDNNIKNVKIINEDFLKYQVPTQNRLKFISNLPYNVGTAIIQKLLPLTNWTEAVFMLQKEVVSRLAAKPGSKDYAYISIFTSYYTESQILFDVSAKCFKPQPKVISSVIKLKNKMSIAPDPLFFKFIKHSFSMRRKTILKVVSSFEGLNKSQALEIVDNLKISPLLRPEKLDISDFLSLTTEIKKYTICRV
ncbi:MAG: 16S rRNA (adenine(1518)-N(6)/adenine(1519)-N(6))-dimethyltransferase RsmA [Endomicrobium sp.]|jgi:16S rRNA (adenine1518-N6/adenine1519-N6)-dimethyltransferase|uniref:16S rRNA (adenine(1518)-N(6)/adenine(1519)-N(6))- dimethyltransferase RsmA n=1 Tax=Candidatus Endomicrobiellum cubanum TaxID=3242325 RepID=UPI00282CB10D|nr:16S rRNA (adenine(1518)-N(6)/adenine(1519)-N(6))-dimethyltransferase RsmA [Endomicrobium sp.]